jgi:hypothetical protein
MCMCCSNPYCSCYRQGLSEGFDLGVRRGYRLGYRHGYADAFSYLPQPTPFHLEIDAILERTLARQAREEPRWSALPQLACGCVGTCFCR